ncbi:hypothetical protein FB45DRAFT_879085 [Roridomyces roridus]|uniref:Zn(2)-C6 fungal-type domain-containing protein n=1 Tax=Roridomyces roridus TaxID=1738132 RepID=A0AAD7B070_9AGAR|nr:hypothetical protein FB45DRAFT_879085 [Roridomyces roridus]
MSHSLQPPPEEYDKPFVLARKRALMACLGCRKRRIRCNAINGYDNPCERCQRRNLPCEYISVAEESQRIASESSPTLTPDSNNARVREFDRIATPTRPHIPPTSSSSSTRGRSRGQGGGSSHAGDSYFDPGFHNMLYTGADGGFEQAHPGRPTIPQQQQFSAHGHGQAFGYENEYGYACAYPQQPWTTPYSQPQQFQPQQQQHNQPYPIPTSDSMYLDAQHPNHSYTLRMETNMYFQ